MFGKKDKKVKNTFYTPMAGESAPPGPWRKMRYVSVHTEAVGSVGKISHYLTGSGDTCIHIGLCGLRSGFFRSEEYAIAETSL